MTMVIIIVAALVVFIMWFFLCVKPDRTRVVNPRCDMKNCVYYNKNAGPCLFCVRMVKTDQFRST